MLATVSARVMVETTRFQEPMPGLQTRRPTFSGYDPNELITAAFPGAIDLFAVPHDITVGRRSSELWFTLKLPVPSGCFADWRLKRQVNQALEALTASLTAKGEKVLRTEDVCITLPKPPAARLKTQPC